MRHLPLSVLGTVLAMATVAAPAQAQNALNGNLTIELGRNLGKERNFKHVATSLGTTFNNGIGLQFDLSLGKYESVTSTQSSAALHGFYQATDALSLGGFFLAEDQRPGNYYYYGVEAAYDTGEFRAEAYVAMRDDRGSTFDGERYGIELAYAPDSWRRFGTFGGAHQETGLPGGDKSIAYLGLDYAFRNNTKLSVTLGRTNLDETVVAAGYTINFGRGATFSRRHSVGVFDAY